MLALVVKHNFLILFYLANTRVNNTPKQFQYK